MIRILTAALSIALGAGQLAPAGEPAADKPPADRRGVAYVKAVTGGYEVRVADPARTGFTTILSLSARPESIYWTEGFGEVLYRAGGRIFRAPWKKDAKPAAVAAIPPDLEKVFLRLWAGKDGAVRFATYEGLERETGGQTVYMYRGRKVDFGEYTQEGLPAVIAVYVYSEPERKWKHAEDIPTSDGACDTPGSDALNEPEQGLTAEKLDRSMDFGVGHEGHTWISVEESDDVRESGTAWIPSAAAPGLGYVVKVRDSGYVPPIAFGGKAGSGAKELYNPGECPGIGFAEQGEYVLAKCLAGEQQARLFRAGSGTLVKIFTQADDVLGWVPLPR